MIRRVINDKSKQRMTSTETGKDKVKKICDVLRRETLEPAKEEAKNIIEKARQEAKLLIEAGKKEAKKLRDAALRKIDEEKELFQASIHVAGKKSVDLLKQEIEEKLFHPALNDLVSSSLSDSAVMAKLITALVEAIQRDGIDAELSVSVPQTVSAQEVNQALAARILDRLSKKSVELGNITGGAKVKLKEKHLTIDISDQAVQQLLAYYIREDFRSIIFQAQ